MNCVLLIAPVGTKVHFLNQLKIIYALNAKVVAYVGNVSIGALPRWLGSFGSYNATIFYVS